MTDQAHQIERPHKGDADLAAILQRVASILSDIHLDGLAIQREFGEIFNDLDEVPPNITELQRLDQLSQMQADLAAYLNVLAKDVARGLVDKARLRDALRLGAMRHLLIDDGQAAPSSCGDEGDLALF